MPFKPYTEDQVFDLLGSVTCETDAIEIEHYVKSHWQYYSALDVRLFLQSINMINQIFK